MQRRLPIGCVWSSLDTEEHHAVLTTHLNSQTWEGILYSAVLAKVFSYHQNCITLDLFCLHHLSQCKHVFGRT
ncbi:hypothetical protein XELAEV_18022617mg [Xenopus laevis]|uniref:Uncharacterized protein n=1 Tax=Xenopus laevis TaxID=8355 RepID=A0A974D2Q5_XENLA|nr:hypothetical protein XELAEV_18022617mg [Xenopus laevis]